MQEKDLKRKLTNGDPEAFRFLFSEYYAALCIYASKFTHEKTSAEEIVHETFVKLWDRRENLEIKESVIGYLYRAVQNNALNYLKALQIKHNYAEAYAQQVKKAEDYISISQETGQSLLLAKELETKIREAIEALPPHCKEIFLLSRFGGLKNQEIADKKNITINTVQTQISIALEKLRNALRSYLPQLLQIMGLTFLLK